MVIDKAYNVIVIWLAYLHLTLVHSKGHILTANYIL